MRTGSPALAAVAALMLALATSACSGANPPKTGSTLPGSTQSHPLVTYEMYGLGSTSLAVTTTGQVKVTSGGGRKVARSQLDGASWKSLRATLDRTNLHALAGDSCPPRPYPDAFIYVITVGHDTVCTTEGLIPHELEPLLTILSNIVSVDVSKS